MWWLEEKPAPSRFERIWLRYIPFRYRGPAAWLVWLNVALSFLALTPLVLFFFLWLNHRFQFLGETQLLLGFFALLLLGAISEISYWVIAPVLVTCFALLISRNIPLKVRLVTGAIQIAACVQLLWIMHGLKIDFKYGLFGHP